MDTPHNTPPPLSARNTPSPAPSEHQALPSPGLSYATNSGDDMDVAPLDHQVMPAQASSEASTCFICIDALLLTSSIALRC